MNKIQIEIIARYCVSIATRILQSLFIVTPVLMLLSPTSAQESPILSFQHHRYSSVTQSYQVDILANGRVIYQGGQNTKRPPYAVYDISPVALQSLVAELDAIQLEQVHIERHQGLSLTPGQERMDLSYITGGTRKSFRFPEVKAAGIGRSFAPELRLLELLEEYVPTEKLRCPAWLDHYSKTPPKNLDVSPDVCAINARKNEAQKQHYEPELKILRQRSPKR